MSLKRLRSSLIDARNDLLHRECVIERVEKRIADEEHTSPNMTGLVHLTDDLRQAIEGHYQVLEHLIEELENEE